MKYLALALGGFRIAENLAALQAVIGYDYDFDREELRRFVWNVGAWTEIWNRSGNDLEPTQAQRTVELEVPAIAGEDATDSFPLRDLVSLALGGRSARSDSDAVRTAVDQALDSVAAIAALERLRERGTWGTHLA